MPPLLLTAYLLAAAFVGVVLPVRLSQRRIARDKRVRVLVEAELDDDLVLDTEDADSGEWPNALLHALIFMTVTAFAALELGASLSAALAGLGASLAMASVGSWMSWLFTTQNRLRLSTPRDVPLTLRRRGVGLMPDDLVGDEAFDREVQVVAPTATDALRYLDADTRRAVRAVVARGGELEDGRLLLDIGMPSEADAPAIGRAFTRAARELAVVPPRGALLERATSDPVPGVRLATLYALEAFWRKRELQDAYAAIRAAAPDAQLGDDPVVDHALLAELADHGGVGEVARLRSYAAGASVELARRAHTAIAAIQSRVGPDAGGRVSVSTHTGALSEARRQGSIEAVRDGPQAPTRGHRSPRR
jgi:hypothetical protein